MWTRLTCVLSCAVLLGIGACERGAKAKRACDQDALAALARQLDAAEPEARVALVAQGLPSACGDSLYPTVQHYLREAAAPDQRLTAAPGQDKAFIAAQVRICPEQDALVKRLGEARSLRYGEIVFETCGLDRYGLMTKQEARELGSAGWMTWTTHELLIANGTPPEVANSISRAMLLFEQVSFGPILIVTLDGQRLPKISVGGPIPEGVPVYASTTELVAVDQRLATLDAGVLRSSDVDHHLIRALYDVLSEEAEKAGAVIAEARDQPWKGRVLVVADGRLPFATLVDILYTGGRAGFSAYSVIVEPQFPVKRAIQLDPPKFSVGQAPRPKFKTFISDEGYHVIGTGDEQAQILAKLEPKGTGPAAWDREGLAGLARAFAKRHPDATMAVVSAENDISVEILMSTYATLLGPDCDQAEGSGCVLPELVVEAGAD